MASTIHPLDSSRLHLYLPAKDKPSFIKLSLLEFKIWMSKQSWEKRTKLEVSHSITWDYTTKLQSKQHKQHGTDTETDTQINKTEQSAPKKTHTLTVNWSTTQETRIYNRKDSLFHKQCWENWTTSCKRTQIQKYKRPECKTGKYKTPKRELRQNTLWHES